MSILKNVIARKWNSFSFPSDWSKIMSATCKSFVPGVLFNLAGEKMKNTVEAKLHLDREYTIGRTDKRLFGSFLEHLGRAIYGGIYEPGHPAANAQGFRLDVLELVRELKVPLVRYPGGNFVSSFRWEDSVGPAELRPRRLDLAWRTVEPNGFGLNEFMEWSKAAGAEAMIALNLGTRGIEAASALVEYCNHPGGSYWSELRISHGARNPHNVRLWCLGNEMDGPWQVGQKTPEEYGRLAFETAKAIKLFDPTLELVACGSSYPGMPTFQQWECTVLDHCYDTVDYLSLHLYTGNKSGDLPTFLAASRGMDRYIEAVTATCDHVKAKKRSGKTMMLSFDEWNVWFHTLSNDRNQTPWQVGPHLLEDVYTFEDALVVGCMLNSLLRHADRIKIACLAQLVNVIAPIMTENGGPAWKQTIFWPFYYASLYGRGTVLDPRIAVPGYDNPEFGETPYLDACAVLDETGDFLTFFMINRHAEESLRVSCSFAGIEPSGKAVHMELAGFHPKTVNTAADPHAVSPKESTDTRQTADGWESVLKPLSWNMIRLALAKTAVR